MGAASHLGIRLGEYDARIRSFVPHYAPMLDAAADVVRVVAPRATVIVDLGIGTGALSARCLRAAPRARIVGLDVDAGMLEMARRRLGARLAPVVGDLTRASLPRCDAVVSSLALHHLSPARVVAALYRRVFAALRPGGAFVVADRYLASDPRLDAQDRAAWTGHLEQRYSAARAHALLRAWAAEDVYRSLADERSTLARAGFDVDVAWRRDGFAVVVGVVPRRRRRTTAESRV